MSPATAHRRRGLLSVPVPIHGGVHEEDFDWQIGVGLTRCIGAYSEARGSLTKWTGLDLQATLPVSAKIDGLFELKVGGTTYQLAMANGTIFRIAGAAVTTLKPGEVAALYDARVLTNLAFLVSGLNPNRKFDGTSITNMGITPPLTAPTVAVGIAGLLTGAYQYKLTFVNGATDGESDPSPASTTVSPSSQRVNLSALAVSTDPQVNLKRLYRTVNGGSAFLFLAEIANSDTTYTDNILDADLAEQVIEDNGVGPQASYLEVYNGMVLLTGLAAPNQSRVAVSGVLRPEAFDPENVYDLDPEETDIITGIRKFGQFVAIGKRNGLFVGEGTVPDGMVFTRTRVVDGPVGNWTIVPYESNLFYLAEKGLQVFTGLGETYLGEPIERTYRTLDVLALQQATGIYYKPLHLLLWNVTTGGLNQSDQWIVYNLITKELTFRQATTARFSTYKDAFGRTKMWVGGYDGKVYTGDTGHSDYGVPILLDVITGPIGFNQKDLDSVNSFRFIETHYEPNGGTAPVTVSYALDSPTSTFFVTGTFIPFADYQVKHALPATAVGRRLFVRYTVTSHEPLVLYPPTVEGQVLGRR
jgi:hypothetical protein